MSSTSDSDPKSPSPGHHNGDCVLDEEAKYHDDPESYDSDLDLTKDVQPISAYVQDRDELFTQVLRTLEPEGRLDALIPEILSVLSRIELEQLCMEHLRQMSAKKLRKIMEGVDINEISSDEEEEKVVQEAVSKWKPLQDETANLEAENQESHEADSGAENGASGSVSRSTSRSRSSSTSSEDSRRRHSRRDRKYRSRRGSRHRHHRHGQHGHRRRRRSRESSRRRRHHHRKSESESEEVDRASVDETSTKSNSAAAPNHFPVLYDVGTNMMIPVLPTVVSSVATASLPTSLSSFVSGAPYGDSTFASASVTHSGIALPTLTTTVGGLLISSTGVPTKKSQYDVSVEDEYETAVFSPPRITEDRLPKSRVARTTSSQKPSALPSDASLIKCEVKKTESLPPLQQHRDSTPPPPGTDGVHFENDMFADNEPEPPGTAEILF